MESIKHRVLWFKKIRSDAITLAFEISSAIKKNYVKYSPKSSDAFEDSMNIPEQVKW